MSKTFWAGWLAIYAVNGNSVEIVQEKILNYASDAQTVRKQILIAKNSGAVYSEGKQ